MTLQEINELICTLDAPPYRAKQLQHWLYKRYAHSYDDMSNFPAYFKSKLSESTYISTLDPVQQLKSNDGTVKTLFSLTDDQTIESALMRYSNDNTRERTTVCVSSQVGCAIGCAFCSTGQQGFERNLTPGEIIGQVLYFARYLRDQSQNQPRQSLPITNVVFMGMGEPLANYENVRQSLDILNSPEGIGLGMRNITISTAGMVPQIRCLGDERLQTGLAISLHASNNELRNKLVPLNRKYPLQELLKACQYHYEMTGRRTSFEYILLEGLNDSLSQAGSLARLLSGMNCHVNLIAANSTPDSTYRPPSQAKVRAFQEELQRRHVTVTLRQPKGKDIDAACGQLRSRFIIK